MMRQLCSVLMGGLGNQMFQYAAARQLALKSDATLVLDTRTGFARDFQYRRKYELSPFNLPSRPATLSERMPVWLYRLGRKLAKRDDQVVQKKTYGTFIVETDEMYLDAVSQVEIDSRTWMLGYWQSPRYFEGIERQIACELMPPESTAELYRRLAAQMRLEPSVAIGIRLYEEGSSPDLHMERIRMQTIDRINSAVEYLKKKYSGSIVYVFCTHRSKVLEELSVGENVVFVTGDDGYSATLDSLWLLTQCRHHVINNSSFFWWGAWLGGQLKDDGPREVIVVDDFANKDSLPVGWTKY